MHTHTHTHTGTPSPHRPVLPLHIRWEVTGSMVPVLKSCLVLLKQALDVALGTVKWLFTGQADNTQTRQTTRGIQRRWKQPKNIWHGMLKHLNQPLWHGIHTEQNQPTQGTVPAKYTAWYPVKVKPARQHMAWYQEKVPNNTLHGIKRKCQTTPGMASSEGATSQTTEGMVSTEGATSQTTHGIKRKCQTTPGMASSEGATSQTPGMASRESAKQHLARYQEEVPNNPWYGIKWR